jgi:peptidoglycan/xylan/chitin deacetylase (PgdA/CDA1 family)
VILNYHRVNDEIKDAVTVGVAQFRRQMTLLRRRRPTDLETVLTGHGQPRYRTVVVVTFDDGYADNYEAARILREAGVPCTFFLSTGIVGTEEAFAHDLQRLGRRVPALTWDQAREMGQAGFRFGNHARTHSRLSELSNGAALAEVRMASEDLIRELGDVSLPGCFSYPHGRPDDLSDGVRAELDRIGIVCCLSAYGGTNPPDFDMMDIRRQGVNHEFTVLGFKALLKGWRVSA